MYSYFEKIGYAKRFILLVILCVIDIAFTYTSYQIYGNWNFEGNPFLPSNPEVFVGMNIYYTAIGAIDPLFGLMYMFIRVMAILSHPLSWLFCKNIDPHPTILPDSMIYTMILVPVIIAYINVRFTKKLIFNKEEVR